MVMNWENFFEPSGGAMYNSLQFGISSIFVDIGAAWANRSIVSRLEQQQLRSVGLSAGTAIRSARADYKSTLEKLQEPEVWKKFGRGSHFKPAWVEAKEARAKARMQERITDARTALSQRTSRIKSQYGSMKRMTRSIGWSYLALGFSSMFETLTSPGLSQAAVNENMGGGQPSFLDSAGAYTQRQRALMAIHESQLGIRNVISQEAQYFHK